MIALADSDLNSVRLAAAFTYRDVLFRRIASCMFYSLALFHYGHIAAAFAFLSF
jgi:hypothetical protein